MVRAVYETTEMTEQHAKDKRMMSPIEKAIPLFFGSFQNTRSATENDRDMQSINRRVARGDVNQVSTNVYPTNIDRYSRTQPNPHYPFAPVILILLPDIQNA